MDRPATQKTNDDIINQFILRQCASKLKEAASDIEKLQSGGSSNLKLSDAYDLVCKVKEIEKFVSGLGL